MPQTATSMGDAFRVPHGIGQPLLHRAVGTQRNARRDPTRYVEAGMDLEPGTSDSVDELAEPCQVWNGLQIGLVVGAKDVQQPTQLDERFPT